MERLTPNWELLDEAVQHLAALFDSNIHWDRHKQDERNFLQYTPDALPYSSETEIGTHLVISKSNANHKLTSSLCVNFKPDEPLSHAFILDRLHARYGTRGLRDTDRRIRILDDHPLEWLIAQGHLMPGTPQTELDERRRRFQQLVELNYCMVLLERAFRVEDFVDFSKVDKGYVD